MLRHLLTTADLTANDLRRLLALSGEFKRDPYRSRSLIAGDSVVLFFNKPSTRTRISFETAVGRLGGVPVSVGPAELQLGRGETIEDSARVISRYARAFVIRTFKDEDVERFACAATIPVINALTDGHHPCQSVADLMTLHERKGDLCECKIAYVGDGNNVAHSLMEAAAIAGLEIVVATPEHYRPDATIVARAQEIASDAGGRVEIVENPVEAVRDADAVYTDTWLSMGHAESERAERLAAFAPYQVNQKLMAHAKRDAIFMHCLPQHRGEEVTAEVVGDVGEEDREVVAAVIEDGAEGAAPRAQAREDDINEAIKLVSDLKGVAGALVVDP
ncbi:MAG: ornithine carbamoyltransferase, partial [Acidobacteriota bacterium]